MDELLSAQGVCDMVPGLTPRHLAQLRYKGIGPRFIKPSSRKVVYRRSEIERWLADNERSSTAEVA